MVTAMVWMEGKDKKRSQKQQHEYEPAKTKHCDDQNIQDPIPKLKDHCPCGSDRGAEQT